VSYYTREKRNNQQKKKKKNKKSPLGDPQVGRKTRGKVVVVARIQSKGRKEKGTAGGVNRKWKGGKGLGHLQSALLGRAGGKGVGRSRVFGLIGGKKKKITTPVSVGDKRREGGGAQTSGGGLCPGGGKGGKLT